MSREDILRELELLPVWQLRQPLPMPFKIEPATADTSTSELVFKEPLVTEEIAKEQTVKEQEPPVAELPVIEISVVESPVLEPSIPEPSIPEPATSAPSVLEAPVTEALAQQQLAPLQMEVPEGVEATSVQEPVLEQALPLPLRFLLSEDSTYAFLIEPYAAENDVQQIETLLKNMIRAMQASCRGDVTDTADNIFAEHTPKVIISLGAEPANQLSGKTHTVDAWRSIQQENQQGYEQIPLIVTYHPAHLLANATDKALAWRDLCAAMKLAQRL